MRAAPRHTKLLCMDNDQRHDVHTLVIGGGQAGLSTSHWLTRAGIDHLVLERQARARR